MAGKKIERGRKCSVCGSKTTFVNSLGIPIWVSTRSTRLLPKKKRKWRCNNCHFRLTMAARRKKMTERQRRVADRRKYAKAIARHGKEGLSAYHREWVRKRILQMGSKAYYKRYGNKKKVKPRPNESQTSDHTP